MVRRVVLGYVGVAWWWCGGSVFYFFIFLVASARGRGRKRGKGREGEVIKKEYLNKLGKKIEFG